MKKQLHPGICLILALMLLAGHLSSCKSSKNTSTSEPTSLKIISHNVWYGFTIAPEREELWLQWMKEQDPDIVSLQELNEFTHRDLEEVAASYGHPHSVLLKEEGFPTGITSRFPIEDTLIVRDGFHHGLIRARIKGMYFYVVHLHPSNWETRQREIGLILENLETLPEGSQVVLAGDFNTFSSLDSTYYAHGRLEPFFAERDSLYGEKNLNRGSLDYLAIRDVLNAGLVDLEAQARDTGFQFTGTFPTRVEKEGEHGDQRRLDYVFATPGLARKVSRAAVLATDTTWLLSDHLPVLVEIQLD